MNRQRRITLLSTAIATLSVALPIFMLAGFLTFDLWVLLLACFVGLCAWLILGEYFILPMIDGMREAELEFRQRFGQCLQCGYRLRGNVSRVCPECGARVPGKDDRGEKIEKSDEVR